MKSVIGRKIIVLALILIATLGIGAPHLVANTYCDTLKKDGGHGLKNLLTAPLEIPVAVQDAHERAGWPVARQVFGIFEGAFKGLNRATAGTWEIFTALLPGPQGKIPIQPEQLF